MKRFLDRITPTFIHNISSRLLKNSPLAWELQLPQVLWLWFVITLVMLPVPLLYKLDLRNRTDVNQVVMIAAFTALLQFFLFSYLLIRFNSTKSYYLL